MNSYSKQETIRPQSSLEELFLEYSGQLSKLDFLQADLLYKKLKFLGLNYDPFSDQNTSECDQIIQDLGLTIHFQNPYLATNILLKLLDMTEECINKLKQ